MVGRVIEGCAKHPFATLLAVAAIAAWSVIALGNTPLDAVPDLSDTQVIVYTEWPGRSPDLVEQQVTYPLSAAFLATPGVKVVRGQSFFGLSFVYVIFDDDVDLYWARTRALERLQSVPGLPEDARPQLGPDATGVGWVYQYALVDRTGRHALDELRAIQDWDIRPALESVEGVAEVASIGGHVRQYQIVIDPDRLSARGVPLSRVVEAVGASNRDSAGETIEVAEHEQMVRGRGFLRGVEDLARIPLSASADGTPIRVADVADVAIVPAARRGIGELDGMGESVGGIVVMRDGQNALDVIDRVKERIREVEAGLPAGVRLEVVYDRSELILAAVSTLKEGLIEEMLVVSLVILLFLLHVRSALVPIITLPIAVLVAFIPMSMMGITANIMSLGGIIVAIGDMVDGSIIVIENVHKRLEQWQHEGQPGRRRDVVISAMKEVGPSIFGSLLVLTVAFLPVLTLASTEGRLFSPLGYTKTFSMAAAAILAVTATPALVVLLVRGRILPEERNVLNRLLIRGYEPVVRWVVRHRWLVVCLAFVAVATTVPAFLRLQGEFMPPLEEMDLLYMPASPPGISETVAFDTLQIMDREIARIPEVERVFGEAGRAETATDPAPLSMFETVVKLKPRDQWRPGVTLEDIKEQLDEAITIPGMPNLWWMPVQTRLEMLATGIRSNLGVKVYGPDQTTIERAAASVAAVLSDVRGARSAYAEREGAGFYVDIDIDRTEAARYGLSVEDVSMVVEAAIAGMEVTEIVDGRRRFPVSVRYARELREDPEALAAILVPVPRPGAQPAMGGMGAPAAGAPLQRLVPLGSLADIRSVTSPMMIRSEAGRLVGTVLVDVDETVRSVPDFVEEAGGVLERAVRLPAGVRTEWSGQFKSYERATDRLMLVVPATLLIVIALLWWTTRSAFETFVVLLAVPFSLIGAIWMVYLLGYKLSVAVWVGLIALAGLDAETGVVMLLYLKLSHARHAEQGRLRTHRDLLDAIVDGAARRIRPKLMTILVNIVGLAPVVLSTGIGSDVMRRVAVPLFGGVITSFLLELTVYPAIFAIWKGYRHGKERAAAPLPAAPEVLT